MNTRLMLILFLFVLAQASVQKGLSQERIVSLAPSLTEIICLLDLCDALVGVTEFCIYPESVKKIPRVGGYIEPNLEVIVGMKPDLILALPEHQASVDKLKSLGLEVHTIRNYSLEDIYESVRRIGELTHRSSAAQAWISQTRAQVDRLTQSFEQRPRCLLVLGHEAGRASVREVYVVGRKGFLYQLLQLAGGENAYPKDTPHFPKVSQEVLLSLNPDVIVELVPLENLPDEDRRQIRRVWNGVPHLKAPPAGRFHILNSTHILQAGPRFVETLEALSEMVRQP